MDGIFQLLSACAQTWTAHFLRPIRLGGLLLLTCMLAHGQNLSFAQPLMQRQSIGLAIWPVNEGGNGHFYETVASPAGITWADAESYAEGRGGYLVTITSARENAFVFKLINSAQFWHNSPDGDSLGPWLGGNYAPPAGADGEAWQWLNHEGSFAYTNWAVQHVSKDDRPDDRPIFFGPGQDNRQATWSAAPASQLLHGFVVEYDTNPLPPTLKYVALFSVCMVGLIALGGIIYFVAVWNRGRKANR